MGVMDWIASRIGHDLDERVSGSSGAARDRFEIAADDVELIVRARIAEHDGTVIVRAQAEGDDPAPLERRSPREATLSLGPAKPWHGGRSTIVADVTQTPSGPTLAVLTVELVQPNADVIDGPPLAFATYSIEGRFDVAGRAALELEVRLG